MKIKNIFGPETINKSSSSNSQASLETRIGLYWLHRLGIVTLVVGLVFLLTYSFQYLGPIIKLIIGALVSAGLLYLGKRESGRKSRKWFADGLSASGWSLAYFTTYAAYYISSVKVIDSAAVETVLLFLVAASSLYSALRSNSQSMAIFSILLASLTILINGPGLLSCISFMIIGLTSAFFGWKKGWHSLLASSLITVYIGLLFSSLETIGSVIKNDKISALGFISGTWLIYSIAIVLAKKNSQQTKPSVIELACLNAMAFLTVMALVVDSSLDQLFKCIILATGIMYLLMSGWLKRNSQHETNWSVHSLIGIFFFNVAKLMQISGMSLLIVDIFQVALLACIGLKYKIKSYQWFAVCLALLFFPFLLTKLAGNHFDVQYGFHAYEYARIAILAGSMLLSLAFLHQRHNEKQFALIYQLAANGAFAIAFFNIADASWQIMAFTLLAVTNFVIAIMQKRDFYSYIALPSIIVAAFLTVQNTDNWLTLPIIASIALMYSAYAFASINPPGSLLESTRVLKVLFALSSNLLLTVFLMVKLPTQYVSLGLGLEGIILIVSGFLLGERLFRLSGLSVLALLTGKLLFIDMARYDTLERILSFIGAGVFFLLSSYGYAKFTDSIENDREPINGCSRNQIS